MASRGEVSGTSGSELIPVCHVVPFVVEVFEVPHLCEKECPPKNLTYPELLRWYWRHPVCSNVPTGQWAIFGFQNPPLQASLVPLRKLFAEGVELLEKESVMGSVLEMTFTEGVEFLKKFEDQLYFPSKFFACGVKARMRSPDVIEWRLHFRYRIRRKDRDAYRGQYYQLVPTDKFGASFEDLVFDWFEAKIGDLEARSAHSTIGGFIDQLRFHWAERSSDAHLLKLKNGGAQ